MATVRLAHSSTLAAATLDSAHAMLVAAFDGDFAPDDWEHSIGGMHAYVEEDGAVVAHAAVVQRRLLHGGRALRAGYVEGVGVRADQRGRGLGRAVMAALDPVLRGAYDLGALGATDAAVGLYRQLGWQQWRGPTSALTPDGIVRTEDADEYVYVLELAAPLDLDGALVCDWRDGDVW